MNGIPIVAIEGGPCGGKSTFLVRAREWLEKYDIYPLIISETATELITAGASPAILGFPAFQEHLFLYSLMREERYLNIANAMKDRKVVIFCDRGVLDCIAYMGEDAFHTMIARLGFAQEELFNRYIIAVHLVTAADGAEEFYTLANNIARTESPEEARELDVKTQKAWLGHPHHVTIDNSTGFERKIQRALCALARRLDMPDPLEIERKFLIPNFCPEFIPKDAVAIHITQDYLVCNGPGTRRVRRRICAGEASYFYTEKIPTGKSGTRIERERQVSASEYVSLLKECDSARDTIMKVRHKFPFGGKIFELDVFEGRLEGLVLLEVELECRDEEVRFPDGWELLEVTDNHAYENSELAKRPTSHTQNIFIRASRRLGSLFRGVCG